jgi:hypothetical protein
MARIEKEQFQNMSGGFIGAVVIGPKGDEKGIPVEPNGTVWLSEEEQILTANAPRLAKDNPFIEWTRTVLNDDTGQWEDQKYTPLVKVQEHRPVPANFRPIPADISDAAATREAAASASGDTPTVATVVEAGAIERHAEVSNMGEGTKPHDPPPVPRRAAMAAAMSEEDDTSDLTPPPDPLPDPTPPGATPDAAPAAEAQADAADAQQEAAAAQEEAAAAQAAAAEETAAKVDPQKGEETGSAVPPNAEAPEGEYAQHEEVGTPEAPAQPSPPPPYTPGSQG